MTVDLSLTAENRLVQRSVREFASAEIEPHIRDWDAKHEVHREVLQRMGEAGFLGAPIPEQYGGSAFDYVSLGILCEEPDAYSDTLTAVVVPDGIDAGEVMRIAAERYGLALGVGLGKLRGRVFRIGHLGALGELEVLATIAGCELALAEAGVDVELGSGVAAAQRAYVPATVGARA